MGINKVVLLGASGQLGQILRTCWQNPTSLVSHSRRARPGFVSFDLSLDQNNAIKVMDSADAVICLSGVTPTHANRTDDPFSLNTDLALAAIHAAHLAGAGRVFLTSTAAVYGRASGVLVEGTECHPVSDYGLAKLEMESAALSRARAINHPATILRIGNVAGADAILGGWREGMQIDQLSDTSTPRRSYIGPETLTRVIQGLVNTHDLPDILNIAAPGAIEMGHLLDAAHLDWSPRPAPQGVIENVELSTKLLERHIEFTTQNSTAAGIVSEWRQVTVPN